MKKIVGLAIAMSLVCTAASAAELWKTLDFPNAIHTCVCGISGDKIVGTYYGEAKIQHGFVFDGHEWKTLDAPEAQCTIVSGISGDKIVGWYEDKSEVAHGFIYEGGKWTILNVPKSMIVNGICGSEIVGMCNDGKQRHGFVYDISSSKWATLDPPDALPGSTSIAGISGEKIVGSFWTIADNAKSHAFVYDRKKESWTTLDPPGFRELSSASGVLGHDIVGTYSDDTATHGFIYDGKNWTKLDAPGATNRTNVSGIAKDKIFGFYSDGEKNHGFIYTRQH